MSELQFHPDENAERKYRPPKLSSNRLSEHLTTIAHVCLISVSAYIVRLCFSAEFELFTWHPFLFSIGWLCIMTEAVLLMRQDNILAANLNTTWRVRLHWLLQTFAIVCCLAGFIVAVLVKINKNKIHFKSWHALCGLLAMISACIPTSISGVTALYSLALHKYVPSKVNKLTHAAMGIVTVILGAITIVLSLYTGWFRRKTDGNQDIFAVCLVNVSFGFVWCLGKCCYVFVARMNEILTK